MEAQAPRCRRQPGGGRRPLVHLRAPAAEPMAQRTHHQRDRAFARGIQAPDQDPNRSSADTAAMLFWALLASGQINMRKVGTRSPQSPSISRLTLPPETIPSCSRRMRHTNSNRISDGTTVVALLALNFADEHLNDARYTRA